MFTWLKNLFGRGDGVADAYHPGDRQIYRYWDGKAWVRCDPMELYKRFLDVQPDLAVDLRVAESTSKDARTADDRAVRRIRELFRLPPFEEGGWGEDEAKGLLRHFLAYCGFEKKTPSPPATSPAATSAPSESSSGGAPATASSSDSGSTATAPATAPPTPPTSAAAPPSG